DSACILPPQHLSERETRTIAAITKRLARHLRVQGLLNIQFAIQGSKVYVLEVNPRASRTVPFISKATGLPIAKIAAKLMVGHSLKGLSEKYGFDLSKTGFDSLPHVAVKEAVLPWTKFPGTNVLLSPEMRSTGEVMGIDSNFPLAFLKSQIASGSDIPLKGAILFSIQDMDKSSTLPIAKRLTQMGFSIFATEGTYRFFSENQIPVESVRKISEGRPNVLDLIKNRQVQMVVNTPSQSETARSDGSKIRSAAIQFQVPIFTTVSALQALQESILKLSKTKDVTHVRSLQDYYKAL
ncbi:MAG: ATP-grasp domain-containing protein, partial [Elusimicrobia bacterium]|nr:ATP-grasp domain-containing protein [Elusimicrobiota bacterium]